MLKYLLPLFFSLSISGQILAKESDDLKSIKHSYLSCSIITSEHLTALQLYQRGLPRDVATASLPSITRAGKKRVKYVYDLAKKVGILNAYADINTNYARCSTLVYQTSGLPAADLLEHNYYYCSGENKIRFEIILKIDQQQSLRNIASKLPARYENIAVDYYNLIRAKGVLAAFDLTANNLKACLNHIQ